MDSFVDIVSAVKDYSRERISPTAYDLFIADIEPVSFENGQAKLRVRSDFIKGIFEERYLTLFTEGFAQVLGFDADIAVEVAEEKADKSSRPIILPGGRYEYTFENFIVGPNNKFAHAAALSVAANPSNSWNPLFFYGASGLGKTHLLFAIRYAIAQEHEDFKIMYVEGERFTNEIIQAIQDKAMSEFHEKYRSVDVLLVDDVQFIGGKESTQEEFFHTFNTLYNAGKQIVLASDRPAKEIRSLDDRLRTRFEWGLTADIQPPDFETRVAIIQRKASLLDFDIPDDVSHYIANHVKDNIRQLEGTVKKLHAYYLLEDIQPVISAAQTAIKDIMSESQPVPITIDKITSEVARTFMVTPEDMRSSKRKANISMARKVSMYCIRQITNISMEEIGAAFGGRDHSTVVYSCNDVGERLQKDQHMREIVEDIIKNVQS